MLRYLELVPQVPEELVVAVHVVWGSSLEAGGPPPPINPATNRNLETVGICLTPITDCQTKG